MASPLVERGGSNTLVMSLSSLGSKVGLGIGAGVRISRLAQFHVSASTSPDFDDLLLRSSIYFESGFTNDR